MSRTSKLLLGVLASMMVCWSLTGADELDPTNASNRTTQVLGRPHGR